MFAARNDVAEGDWDEALLAMDGHFLQSTAWQRTQRALGYGVMCARNATWMWAGAVRAGRFPRYLYVPYGPTGDAAEALHNAITCAQRNHLDFVRAEPVSAGARSLLRTAGAVAGRSIQPRYTWILDLVPPETELRQALSSGHRGSINAAERRGLRFTAGRDPRRIDVFLDLQQRAGRSGAYTGHSEQYHRTVASVLMPLGAAQLYEAEADGQVVAAALCFDFGRTRYYAHAVSDPQLGRRLGAAAPLVWRMVLDARAEGREVFDFWGVAPHAPAGDPWAGFTQFKMAFGGRLVERAGTWDLPTRRLRYRLFSALQRARR